MCARRSGPRGCRGRPSTSVRRTRVYYDIAALWSLLQQFCPEILRYLPTPESFATYRGANLTDREDQSMIALLEVGRVWPARGANEAKRAVLCVWDRGGFSSDAPDLVPYSVEGSSERTLVDANGFDATGVFAELRESRTPRRNPDLDDPLVIALFQFIMMLRNNRRYYWYGGRHWESPREHIAPLIQALHIITLRQRQPNSGEPRQMLAGAAVPSRQPPPPFASPYQPPMMLPNHEMQSRNTLLTSSFGFQTASRMLPSTHPLPLMPASPPTHRRLPHIDPRLRTKQMLLSTAVGRLEVSSPQDSVFNGNVDNDLESYTLITTEGTGRAAGTSSTTEDPMQHEVGARVEVPSPRPDNQIQLPL